jgi:hypothetical protein
MLKSRCSEMQFQANPDDIKSLVTRLTYHTNFTATRAIIVGKNEKNKRLDDKNEPKENLKKQ